MHCVTTQKNEGPKIKQSVFEIEDHCVFATYSVYFLGYFD